jgi:hypothetical protein
MKNPINFDLQITHKGVDMGITPISLHGKKWQLCDACYALADKVGTEVYELWMRQIMGMIQKGNRNATIGVLSFSVTLSA